MAKRVILAVAGAGKTYTICNQIDENKKNLIIAYTNENIFNIKKELIKKFGYIPKLTSVLTFHSFIYRHMICPYEPTILNKFGESNFKRKGITLKDPPPIRLANRKYNYKYIKNNKLGHYNCNGFYYCANLSELILNTDKGNVKNGIIKKITNRMNIFYDQIMIDEFQDFRENDYKLIMRLVKNIENILLVGDYYQNSVSGKNNSGVPFKKGKVDLTYDEFLELLIENNLDVDCMTLSNSRRCSEKVCEFISTKLSISIKSDNNNQGSVIFVEENDIKNILENDSIVKLVYKDANKYRFNAVNWSYSKGNTYDCTCVILTEKFENIDSEEFDISSIAGITKNKFYVALSRTKGNLLFIRKSNFDKIKNLYTK